MDKFLAITGTSGKSRKNEQLGKKPVFFNVPFPIAYLFAWILFFVSFTQQDYREKVQRLCEPRIFSHEAATKDFDYSPCSFEEGITDEIKEYKNWLLKNKS
ncbi:hypothetical protein [Cloacibacillus porcorum]|uniref:hypothetical protein n=1 Tax=Cloacibacillus porcorum TaxID=1197717 RepID=UPI0023F01540|nr:hypothetical protein [Cloacibacillus porcorum]MDD7650006.1 hypothetical protein [Cloacibacillus porcorum]MDY4093365.1 hypothetical protein [Cloacibacillus porcorum]